MTTMPGHDTSPTALDRQRDAFRRMTPEQRVALAVEMSEEIRDVTEAGIRHRHPALTDDEVRAALAAIFLGRGAAGQRRPRSPGSRPMSLAELLAATIARLEHAGVPYMQEWWSGAQALRSTD